MTSEKIAEMIAGFKAQNDEHQTAAALLLELGGVELFIKFYEKGQALNIPKTKLLQAWVTFTMALPFSTLAGNNVTVKLIGAKILMDAYEASWEVSAIGLLEDEQ